MSVSAQLVRRTVLNEPVLRAGADFVELTVRAVTTEMAAFDRTVAKVQKLVTLSEKMKIDAAFAR